MSATERTDGDALLDLLAETVARRLNDRRQSSKRRTATGRRAISQSRPVRTLSGLPVATGQDPSPAGALPIPTGDAPPTHPVDSAVVLVPDALDSPAGERPTVDAGGSAGPSKPEVPAFAAVDPAALLARLACALLFMVVLINVPLNTRGTALARAIPSSASLVIGDGLVVKEADSPRIWVYRDGAFHWITTLDAFTYFGYRWQDVHVVPAGFLNRYPKGNSVYVLLKCDASPNIYALEGGTKRWIVDIPTFTAQGFVWSDVKFVSCDALRALPTGDSIPPGRGAPPTPLP